MSSIVRHWQDVVRRVSLIETLWITAGYYAINSFFIVAGSTIFNHGGQNAIAPFFGVMFFAMFLLPARFFLNCALRVALLWRSQTLPIYVAVFVLASPSMWAIFLSNMATPALPSEPIILVFLEAIPRGLLGYAFYRADHPTLFCRIPHGILGRHAGMIVTLCVVLGIRGLVTDIQQEQHNFQTRRECQNLSPVECATRNLPHIITPGGEDLPQQLGIGHGGSFLKPVPRKTDKPDIPYLLGKNSCLPCYDTSYPSEP